MSPSTPVILGLASVAGILLAYLIYLSLGLFVRPGSNGAGAARPMADRSLQPVFLFDGDFLMDATHSASDLVANRPEGVSEYEALITLLERQFPSIRNEVEKVTDSAESAMLVSDSLGLSVTLQRTGDLIRIALGDPESQDHLQFAEIERAAQVEELALLRNLTDNAPQMIWLEDIEGNLLWANSAYLALEDALGKAAKKANTVWPQGRIFHNIVCPEPGDISNMRNRYSIKRPGAKGEDWFDITSIPQAGGVLHYAVDANDAVRAEMAKRDFQQTLSKTFAQLSIGLAIFDKDRKLTLFNPAIMDLTGLPADFLSARPSIQMVLDRLRESRMLPEPKDYSSWREQFTALEAAAEKGSYCENWDLPDGQTFRVIGRPHPDGALAFLFEDISAEVLLTRRFRSEIKTSHAVLDSLSEAIAVFSNAGTLMMTNEAYDNLWGITDTEAMLSRDLRASILTWKSKTIATPIWREVEDVAMSLGNRVPMIETITLTDGRTAACHAIPLEGGMTLVKFAITAGSVPAVRKLQISDPQPRAIKST